MTRNEPIDLDKLTIVLRFVDKDYSRYTLFVPLFKFSKSFLRLYDKFFFYLKPNYKSRRYSSTKIANLIVNLICCGVDRFVRMDDEFRIEKGLAKSLGFPRGFPTSDTIYRYLRTMDGFNIRQLERINLELLKEQKEGWCPPKGPVFVDLDMNVKSVEGKQEKASVGYNKRKRGRRSLKWSLGYVAKVALFPEVDAGTTSERVVLERQVERMTKLLREIGLEESRLVFRVDGGYFSWENLAFLNRRKFMIRLPYNLKPLKPYQESQLKWKKYSQASELADLGRIHFSAVDGGTDFRVVMLRVTGKEDTKLYPLCTNVDDWSGRTLVKAYRGRQLVENYFRDTNQAFYGHKLPSASLQANQAFLWFICLAYNQFFFFRNKNQIFRK